MDREIVQSIVVVLGYFVLAHVAIEVLLGILYTYIGKSRKPHKLTATLGWIDRAAYAALFIFNLYILIGLWFSVKVASRLIGGDKEFREEGERRNIYIIGNAISLALGILGGYLVKFLF